MKLITSTLAKKLQKIDPHKLPKDPMAHARFFGTFRGIDRWSWYILQGRPDIHKQSRYDDDFLCLAFVDGHYPEFGVVSIKELEELRSPFGAAVERDLYFRPCRLSEACWAFREMLGEGVVEEDEEDEEDD